jgi:hypothetical protein
MSDNVLQLEVPALHCDVNLKSTAMQGPRTAQLIRRVRYAAYFSGGRVVNLPPDGKCRPHGDIWSDQAELAKISQQAEQIILGDFQHSRAAA